VPTQDPTTGNAANASAIAGFLRRNGADTAETATVSNLDTGDYVLSGAIPAAWAMGDQVELVAEATCGGKAGRRVFDLGRLEPEPFLAGAVSDVTPAAGQFDAAAGLSSDDDEYQGMWLVFVSGGLRGIPQKVTGYTGATRTFAFANPFPGTPANGDRFWLIGRGS
jgi:hypothetical protein